MRVLSRWVWAFVAGAAVARAGPSPSPEAPEAAVSLDDLRAMAFTEKQTYTLGEPVLLWIAFANVSYDQKFEVSGNIHPVNDFEIEIQREGELARRFTAGEAEVIMPSVTFIVRPRQIHTQRWMVCHEPKNKTGFVFERAGAYTISCRMRLFINRVRKDLNFNRIRITVTEPAPALRKALEMIMTPACAADLQAVRARDETKKIWEEFVRLYPNNIWTPYAKLLLAWHAWQSERADYQALAKQFEQLLEAGRNFLLKDNAYYGCAACQDRLGKPLEALRWLYELQRTFPISPYVRGGSPLVSKYIHREGWDKRYDPWYLRE